jgi:hypothetical protein
LGKGKIDKQLHVPDDIERNGAWQGSHTGPTEHNHIRLANALPKVRNSMPNVLTDTWVNVSVMRIFVDMAYQQMATPYDQPPQASFSLVQTFTEVSLQASKGWLLIVNNPA